MGVILKLNISRIPKQKNNFDFFLIEIHLKRRLRSDSERQYE